MLTRDNESKAMVITLRASEAAAQCVVIAAVCLCIFWLWVCYHDNSKLHASILTKLGLQVKVVTISSWINFGRPARAPGKGVCGGAKFLAPPETALTVVVLESKRPLIACHRIVQNCYVTALSKWILYRRAVIFAVVLLSELSDAISYFNSQQHRTERSAEKLPERDVHLSCQSNGCVRNSTDVEMQREILHRQRVLKQATAIVVRNSIFTHLLPPPRRLCFCLCLYVCQQDNSKSCWRISMDFLEGGLCG